MTEAADRVAEYEQAGVTWWFCDGWHATVDALRKRIAAGPPR